MLTEKASHQGTRDQGDEEGAEVWRGVPEQFIVIFMHRISVFVVLYLNYIETF